MIVRLPAALDVAGRAEEALRLLEGVGLEAAGHDLARAGGERVVGAREPGDRVEQDDDMLPLLDQAPGLLADHLGAVDVVLRCLVERRRDDLALGVPPEVGHLLGALVDQQADQLRGRAVLRDRVGDVLQEDRLARARRRDDEAALAESDGREDVHGAHRDVLLGLDVLEQDPLERVIGDQLLERGDLRDLVGVAPHHLVDPHDRRAALAFPRGLDQHLDPVAALEPVAPDQALGKVRILRIEAVVDLLVDDERSAVGDIDVAAVGQRAARLRRRGKDLAGSAGGGWGRPRTGPSGPRANAVRSARLSE